MDEADRTWIEKLFNRNADPVESATADLADLVKAHGQPAVDAAIAKSRPATTPTEAPEVDGIEWSAEDLAAFAAVGLAPDITGAGKPVAKAEPDPIGDRLTAIEATLAKLANPGEKPEPVVKASPDIISLVKQGVPPHAIEGAKGLLEHADADVRQAAADMLVKQADPRIVALLKGEAGNAAIPADETEVKAALDSLAKQAGEKPNGKASNEITEALKALAANGGSF